MENKNRNEWADSSKKASDGIAGLVLVGCVIIVLMLLIHAVYTRSNVTAIDTNTPQSTRTTQSTQTNPSTSLDQKSITPGQTMQQSQNISTSAVGDLKPSLINQIESAIVEVNCYSSDSSSVVQGSGMSVHLNGATHIYSNYHVLAEAETAGTARMPTCWATYPEPPYFTFNENYGDYQLVFLSGNYNPNIYEDSSVFALGTPFSPAATLANTPAINDVPQFAHLGCSDVNVGDKVTIFGYPNSGNLLGISETVTNGKISGILPGPVYKTDAPIDHGNSGGIAILDKVPCLLGIPTLGQSGLTGGTGYIQSFNLASQVTN